ARGALNSLHPVGRTGTPRGIGDAVCIPGQPELQLRYRTGGGCRWWKGCSVAHVYAVRRKTMFLGLGLLARYGRWEEYERARVACVDEILLSLLDVLELGSVRYKRFEVIACHVTNQIGKYLIFLEGTPQKTQVF